MRIICQSRHCQRGDRSDQRRTHCRSRDFATGNYAAAWAGRNSDRRRFIHRAVNADERDLSMLYSNHSCDPNIGLRGEITFVAMRNIHAGEELTHDWAMTDDDDYSVECNCGARNCRKTLTGKDWQRPEAQKKYAGYFSAYLAAKISNHSRAAGTELT